MEEVDVRSEHVASSRVDEESTWPAERTPGRLDAEQAQQPLESSFVSTFKNALLASTAGQEIVPYLNDRTEQLCLTSVSPAIDPSYPLLLLSSFPEVPSDRDVASAIALFKSFVHPRIVLLSSISIEQLMPRDAPKYLIFSMALLGLVASGGHESEAENMWLAATLLIATTLEVDNREARKADLLNAWTMLECYGALSADASIWRRTNLTHGYVETAARRLCMSASQYDSSISMRNVGGRTHQEIQRAAIPAFILIDLIRSIHFNLPPTLAVFEMLSYPTQLNDELSLIYTSVVLNATEPPAGVSAESAFLTLVAILSNMHTLWSVFSPLQQESIPTNKTDHFFNPYLPLSTTNETRQISKKLQKALDLWGAKYLDISSKQTITFYIFCKMYSELPTLPFLPVIARYKPRKEPGEAAIHYYTGKLDTELKESPKALKYAWEILENVERSEGITPVWFPVVVFYASLVVWRGIILEAKSATYGSLRVLQLFRNELEYMRWPCCSEMIETLDALTQS